MRIQKSEKPSKKTRRDRTGRIFDPCISGRSSFSDSNYRYLWLVQKRAVPLRLSPFLAVSRHPIVDSLFRRAESSLLRSRRCSITPRPLIPSAHSSISILLPLERSMLWGWITFPGTKKQCVLLSRKRCLSMRISGIP